MCDQAAPIYQAIEFIESHLQEDINVTQIADAAGYSLFHFMRKFNQMVHHTPYDYLMRRRLTEASGQLIHSDRRVIDIAQDYCFNDQETFSRVFRKMFQITPSQCRKGNGVSLQYKMQAKTIEELRFINSDHFIKPVIVEECDLHLYGLMTSLDEKETGRAYGRERLIKDLFAASIFEPQTKVYELEFCLNPKHETPYYYVGVEETFFGKRPPLFVKQTISTGRFVKMDVPESEIKMAAQYMHSTWIPRTGLMAKNEVTVLCWPIESNSQERIKTILIPVE